MPYITYFIPLIIGCLFPFWGFVSAIYLLYSNKSYKFTCQVVPLLLMSLFMGLLAFTQKPATDVETDCIRYYFGLMEFENTPLKRVWENMDFLETVNFVFYPLSRLLVSATGNVQSISLVWVTITYFAFYCSILRISNYLKLERKDFASFVVFSTFFLVLFVQVSDLLKNATGFAVMFLAWTYYITEGRNMRSLLFSVIAIGIHPSSILLLCLFLCKRFKTDKLIFYSFGLIPVALMAGNVFVFFLNMFSGTIFTDMLLDRFGDYGEGKSVTLLYLVIVVNIYVLSIYIWRKSGKQNDLIVNAAIIFVIICLLNYANFVAFKRLTLFSHSIYIPLLIRYYSLTRSFRHDSIVLVSVLMMCLCFNTYTRGRLYGHYSSSYMNNSILRISTSTLPDYLTEKWY